MNPGHFTPADRYIVSLDNKAEIDKRFRYVSIL